MHSRITLLEIDTLRVSLAEAVETFRSAVMPGLKALDGYEGLVLLTTPEGKGMIITVWRTEADAARAASFGTAALEEHMALFAAPPGREYYEVAVADMPGMRAA